MTASPDVEYQISEDDYAYAIRLGIPLTAWRMGLLAVMFLGLAAGAIWGKTPLQEVCLGGAVALPVMVVWMRVYLIGYVARRNYRKYKAMQMPVRAALKPEGLSFESRDAQGLVRWENMLKWRHDERFVLIYLAPRLFHVVPKSIAAKGFDLEGLLQALNDQVGPPV